MSGNSLIVPSGDSAIIPFDSTPDYLVEAREKAKEYGPSPFTKEDYVTPRIYLLQGLSPQIPLYPGQARIGTFWHGGMNVSLGEEFNFVIIKSSKRVILWRPRSDGGNMMALSRNGITWDMGGNERFEVIPKNSRTKVTWNTGNNVLDSGLTQYGSSDPDDPKSPPAAEVNHELLLYIIGHPELSPVVFSTRSTALKNSRMLLTTIDSQMRAGRPMHTLAFRAFVQSKTNKHGTWNMPAFAPAGFVPKPLYDEVTALADKFKDYKVEYTQEETDEVSVPKYETAY